MILINSLYVLPRQYNIIIYDNLQSQEILRLNGKSFNTIFNIVDKARHLGFIYTSRDSDGVKKWCLETKDTSIEALLHYTEIFSTTYYLEELEHYWLCPDCMSAVPTTWKKCLVC